MADEEKEREEGLLVRMAQGDRAAYEALFRRYYASMVLYANRLLKDKQESEDVVGDLFYDLWERRQRLGEVKRDKDYLFILLRNRVVDCLRRRQKFRQEELGDYEGEMVESVEETMHEVEIYRQLHEAVETLPKKCAEVLRLKLEGFDDHEIAERLGVEYETVRSHTKRGVRMLRGQLDNPFMSLLF